VSAETAGLFVDEFLKPRFESDKTFVSDPATNTKKSCDSAKRGIAWTALLAVLFLRLCLGWHFFSEGTKKLSYNPDEGRWQVTFSAEGFLKQATGPLAGLYKGQLPKVHDWHEFLVVAKELKPLTEDQRYEREDWIQAYNRIKPGQPHEVELFPEFVPYHGWGKRVEADRRMALKKFIDLKPLTDEQRAAAADVFQMRLQQVADYLAGEWEAIEEYQHELWRLSKMQGQAGADEVPFEKARVQEKSTDTTRKPLAWVRAIQNFDEAYANDLRSLISNEQREANPGLLAKADRVLADPQKRRLGWVNLGITGLIIGVGVCLLLGLFTRLAAVGGALFLLSVMLTQLPWVEGANTMFFYYQLVEFAAMVAMAAGIAKHVPGLDYVIGGLGYKCCGARKS